MKKTKKILFPTDFSPPSVNAFQYLLKFAKTLKANVEVLHVVYPQGESLDFPTMVAQANRAEVDRAQKRLKAFIEEGIQTAGMDFSRSAFVEKDIEVGTPVQCITQVALRDQADLIVIGSRGQKRSMVDKWIGRIAAKVVQSAPCPVLVIPENAAFESVNTIAYATDTRDADPYEIWRATQLLEPFVPVIHCVHINMKKEGDFDAWSKMEKMQTFFADRTPGMAFHIHNLPGTQLEKDLNEFVSNHDVQLLVMYQPHHNFWDQLFHKSITRRMAIRTKVPLLVLPEG